MLKVHRLTGSLIEFLSGKSARHFFAIVWIVSLKVVSKELPQVDFKY
jgi:hypothetical protein